MGLVRSRYIVPHAQCNQKKKDAYIQVGEELMPLKNMFLSRMSARYAYTNVGSCDETVLIELSQLAHLPEVTFSRQALYMHQDRDGFHVRCAPEPVLYNAVNLRARSQSKLPAGVKFQTPSRKHFFTRYRPLLNFWCICCLSIFQA